MLWSIIICNPHQMLLADEVKKDEMGETCSSFEK